MFKHGSLTFTCVVKNRIKTYFAQNLYKADMSLKQTIFCTDGVRFTDSTRVKIQDIYTTYALAAYNFAVQTFQKFAEFTFAVCKKKTVIFREF